MQESDLGEEGQEDRESSFEKSKKIKAVTCQKSETKTDLKKASWKCLKRDVEELEMMEDLHQIITEKERKEDEQTTKEENLFGSTVAA